MKNIINLIHLVPVVPCRCAPMRCSTTMGGDFQACGHFTSPLCVEGKAHARGGNENNLHAASAVVTASHLPRGASSSAPAGAAAPTWRLDAQKCRSTSLCMPRGGACMPEPVSALAAWRPARGNRHMYGGNSTPVSTRRKARMFVVMARKHELCGAAVGGRRKCVRPASSQK